MSAYIIQSSKPIPLGAKLFTLILLILLLLAIRFTYDEELQTCLNEHHEYTAQDCRWVIQTRE